MHPIQQHTGHPLQTLREGRQTLDRSSNGAVDNEQHLIHHLALLELPLNLPQTHLIIHPGLKSNHKKRDIKTMHFAKSFLPPQFETVMCSQDTAL